MIRRFVGPILRGREKFSAGSQKSILSPEFGKRSCISRTQSGYVAELASMRSNRCMQLKGPMWLQILTIIAVFNLCEAGVKMGWDEIGEWIKAWIDKHPD